MRTSKMRLILSPTNKQTEEHDKSLNLHYPNVLVTDFFVYQNFIAKIDPKNNERGTPQ
jgi:hypothetical protein